MYYQNFGGGNPGSGSAGGSSYSGFTGNISGGPTERGTGAGNGSRGSGSHPGEGSPFNGTNLDEFYKLPTLTKQDQVEIIAELTQGSEINMTPSKLVEVLNDHIIS